jgi:hypothetical protein
MQLGISSIEDISRQYADHKDLNSFLIDSHLEKEQSKDKGPDLSPSL